MGKLEILASELVAGHPDTGAYDADHGVAADQLNEPNRFRDREYVPCADMLRACDSDEIQGLANARLESRFWGIMSMGELHMTGTVVQLLRDLFGQGSATAVALNAMRQETISRATEIGVNGKVGAGAVAQARAL